MELTIDRRELARALGPVSRVAGRKTPMQVLENLRLSASASTLGITATTLQQSARAKSVDLEHHKREAERIAREGKAGVKRGGRGKRGKRAETAGAAEE